MVQPEDYKSICVLLHLRVTHSRGMGFVLKLVHSHLN